MEIDVDDFLQYPEDNFHGGFGDTPEEGNGEQRNGEPWAPKRRNTVTNEIAGKIAALDEAVLDDSLDWYLRIDLVDDKSASKQRELNRQLNNAIQRIKLAKSCKMQENEQSSEEGNHALLENTGKILNYPPRRNVHWLPITTPMEKTRLYITMKQDDRNLQREMREVRLWRNSGLLLGHDFQAMLADAKKMDESRHTADESISDINTVPDTCGIYFTEPMDSEPLPVDEARKADSVLWVDKYKPRGYIDLLSDDGVNRTLLTWLKLWDECVFGRKLSNPCANVKRFTGPSVFKELAAKKAGFRYGRFNKGPMNAFNNADQLPTTLDSYKRPQHKVALLSGPPGVGKTTLAHVIAKHAGYYVQEMNASDDRTLDAFKKQLEGATQMQATLDSVRRPHCLVIDEIDGAPVHSVNYLVSLINAAGDNEAANKTQTGKSKSQMVLRRPIICICNDLYAPSLRELRKAALVLQVPAIELSRMTERLGQIARRESISAEPGSLELMCTKAGFDIRSCINTLQLMTSGDAALRNEKRLTLLQVTQANVGNKDMHRSLFSTWQEIFQMPKVQKRSLTNELAASALTMRVQSILRACEECGEEDRLRAGLFENYLVVDYRDPRLEVTTNGLDWLCFVDRLDRLIAESQMFEMKRYNVYLSAVFHLLFASRQFTKLSYPHLISEAPFKISKTLAILHSLLNEVKCTIRTFLDCNVLVLDTLPLVLELIRPNLRPVNVQLYSDQEKALLHSAVAIMRDYSLTYRQQRSVQGDYEFVLEPPVEDIVRISSSGEKIGKQTISSRKPLPNTVKQIIAHEIELAKVRSKETKNGGVPATNVNSPKPVESKSLHTPSILPRDEQPSSVQQRLIGLAQGRNMPINKAPVGREDKNHQGEARSIWFKHNEGCNNAVRRRLRVADLL